MEVSMVGQAASLAASLVLGVLFGALYDVIRFTRVLLCVDARPPHGRRGWLRCFIVALGDLLFFVLAAVLMCVFFFVTNNGEVRGFALLGAFCGFLVYYNTVGRLFIAICETVAAWVKRGLRCLAKLLWMPVRFLGRHLRAFAGKIAKPIVSRVFAWYNKKKEANIEKKRKRRAKRRMERCGDVCRNGTET